MRRTKSSQRWLQEHFADVYVKQAQAEGYRSRAVYKLQEIDAKEHLLKPGMTVVDLGAAPGGWTQYVAATLPERAVDVVLSDMAPNMSGNTEVDMTRAMYLAELAVDFAYQRLKPGGTLVMKLFHGVGFDALVKEVRPRFRHVSIRKPKASRSRSRETYLLAKGYIL